MKKLAVLLLTLLLVLVAAVPAAAAPPVIEKGEYDYTWYLKELSDLCGFDVYDHTVGSWQLTTFYDNEGNPIGIKSLAKGTDELYSLAPSGMRLIGNYTEIYMEDFVTGSWSAPGTYFSITVPGYGIVFKEAGLLRYPHPGRVVGIHTWFDPDKIKLVCSLLAGK